MIDLLIFWPPSELPAPVAELKLLLCALVLEINAASRNWVRPME